MKGGRLDGTFVGRNRPGEIIVMRGTVLALKGGIAPVVWFPALLAERLGSIEKF
jgi:hypothetical protein